MNVALNMQIYVYTQPADTAIQRAFNSNNDPIKATIIIIFRLYSTETIIAMNHLPENITRVIYNVSVPRTFIYDHKDYDYLIYSTHILQYDHVQTLIGVNIEAGQVSRWHSQNAPSMTDKTNQIVQCIHYRLESIQ